MEETKQESVPAYTDGMPGAGGEGEVDPNLQKKVDSFNMVLVNLMHSEETKAATMDMLKDDGDGDDSVTDPFLTVPQAAVTINDMAVALMGESGGTPDFGVQLAGSVMLLNDLIQLGYASQLWEELSEEDIKMIYEDTLQVVIERGLKDGSIDPIQLQMDAEGLMDDNQKSVGDKLAIEKGLGSEPSQQAMTEQFAVGRERKVAEKATAAGAQKKSQAMNLGQGGGPQ